MIWNEGSFVSKVLSFSLTLANNSNPMHDHSLSVSPSNLRSKKPKPSFIIHLNDTKPYFQYWANQSPIGVPHLLSDGRSIFGAAIMSDLGTSSANDFAFDLHHPPTLLLMKQLLNTTKFNDTYDPIHIPSFLTAKSFPQFLKQRDRLNLVINRIENIQYLEHFLPFHLIKWNAIYTESCPLFPNGHPTERGLMWAHYRIWKEFITFDEELIHSYSYDQEKNMKNRTIMSSDGRYLIDEQGKFYKNGLPFDWMDRLVIFEDDVAHAIKELNDTMIEELNDIKNIDFIYLGWCEGRAARPVPLCSHSYAITREGAKKLVKYFEPCGRAVDEQFVIMMKNKWVQYRRAHSYSYSKEMIRPDFPCHRDKTFGIFRQCKQLYGSLLGH